MTLYQVESGVIYNMDAVCSIKRDVLSGGWVLAFPNASAILNGDRAALFEQWMNTQLINQNTTKKEIPCQHSRKK